MTHPFLQKLRQNETKETKVLLDALEKAMEVLEDLRDDEWMNDHSYPRICGEALEEISTLFPPQE